MDPKDVEKWAVERETSFDINDLKREFDAGKETLWDALEELKITSYRDIAEPRSPGAIEEGVIRDYGVRYRIND